MSNYFLILRSNVINIQPIVPDLSSNDEDDGDGDGSIGEIQGNKVKKEFTVDDIVGPRLYSDPEDEGRRYFVSY